MSGKKEPIRIESHLEVTADHVDRAKEALILRRDTHIDSLVERLREARIRRVVELSWRASFPEEEVPKDDVEFVRDLGLVASVPSGLGMANPIYREVVTSVTELYLPIGERSWVLADGGLDFDGVLDAFVDFWREHAESFLKRQPYSEAAAQLVCMAYFQRIVNAGGFIDLSYRRQGRRSREDEAADSDKTATF